MIVCETFGAELERSTLEMGDGSEEELPAFSVTLTEPPAADDVGELDDGGNVKASSAWDISGMMMPISVITLLALCIEAVLPQPLSCAKSLCVVVDVNLVLDEQSGGKPKEETKGERIIRKSIDPTASERTKYLKKKYILFKKGGFKPNGVKLANLLKNGTPILKRTREMKATLTF